MRRTEQLQGLRLMKFEEVYERSFRGELSQLEAAEVLGMSERTFRRWPDRYEAERAEGLYDRRHIPNRRPGNTCSRISVPAAHAGTRWTTKDSSRNQRPPCCLSTASVACR